jgi:alpha-1,2-mannosyltransferase
VPDSLFELVNPWTTPLAIVAGIVLFAALVRFRGRRLAMIAATAAFGVAMWQAWKSGPPSGLLDLQIYTNAARAWIDGGSLYSYHDPVFNLSATYPPIGPLMFSAFTPFTADGREIVFTCVSLIALGGCAWFTAGLAGVGRERRVEWSLWAFAAAVVTIPVWLTLRQGQVNILLWCLVLADMDALRRAARWSGLGIGLATAIKLLPGLFIVWLAATRRWAATLRAVAMVLAATALGWVLAPADSRTYWTDLLWHSDRVGALDDARNNSVLGTLARSLHAGPTRTGLWIAFGAAVLVIALVRSIRASRQGDLLAATAIVGCATALISPISWTHHLGFLLIALAAFVMSTRSTWARAACAVAWLVLVDPGGHGDEAWLSTVRGLMAFVAIVFVPIRAGRSAMADAQQSTDSPAAIGAASVEINGSR